MLVDTKARKTKCQVSSEDRTFSSLPLNSLVPMSPLDTWGTCFYSRTICFHTFNSTLLLPFWATKTLCTCSQPLFPSTQTLFPSPCFQAPSQSPLASQPKPFKSHSQPLYRHALTPYSQVPCPYTHSPPNYSPFASLVF